MASLGDAGVSLTDIALELSIAKSKVWAILNGHQRAPPELGPASRAVEGMHAAGPTTEDVAEPIPAQPCTVRRWLRGTGRPSAKHAERK